MSPKARQLLIDYAWPGNVRELQNTIYRLVCLRERNPLTPEDVHMSLLGQVPKCIPEESAYRLSPFVEGFSIKTELANLRQVYMEKALKQTGGNLTKAAGLLGTKKGTLSDWLKA